MLKNYFKIALRTLKRNKSYTIISITGLSVGIAAFLLIYLIIHYELSFNDSFANKERIYRVVSASAIPGGTDYSSGAPFPAADGLRREYPQLENVGAIYGTDGLITILSKDNRTVEKKFNEQEGIFYAEPQFFQIFNFKWLSGNPESALTAPNSVVLTKDAAEKYFGDWKTAVGKSIEYKNSIMLNVAGILDDIHSNNDFPLKVIISYKTFEDRNPKNFKDWISVFGKNNCFIILPKNISALEFDKKLSEFVKEHKPPEYVKDMLILQPLSQMHFDNRFGIYSNNTFSYGMITALSLIAIFLLIIACVNFINLSTAQAVNRSREVGVRKVLGSSRKQLVIQFISETALITFFSIIIGLVLAEIFLPAFNSFLKLQISLNIITDPQIILSVILVTIGVTFLSGFYPALVMSGFNPVTVFKSKVSAHKTSGLSLRRTLVVFQFIVAQILLMGLLVAVNQMHYFQNFDLGFNKNAVVLVPIPGDSLSMSKIGSLKNQLLLQSGIKYVSSSNVPPNYDSHWRSDFKYDGSPRYTDFAAVLLWTDADYFKLFDIKLVAGRFYNQSDSVREFVVNETLVKKLGIHNPQDIIGKQFNFWKGRIVAPVVGVVKDFNASPLNTPMDPVVMGSWRSTYRMLNIKLEPGSINQTMSSIEKIWNSTFPNYVYEYHFLDQTIADFYKQGDRILLLLNVFAAIAISISCLGLYGLISFMTVQKTKEVGIRKVLGASVTDIVLIYSKEFTILILAAFVIAAPLSYLEMNNWLSNYAYHIKLGPGLFLLAFLGTILIAWITVGYRTIKSATANPVKSLRYQ